MVEYDDDDGHEDEPEDTSDNSSACVDEILMTEQNRCPEISI